MAEESVFGTPVELDDAHLGLVKRLAEARKAQSDWKKIEQEIRQELLAVVDTAGTNQALTASGAPAYTVRHSTRRTVDSTKLEAMYPEVYIDVVKESEVLTLVLGD